MQVGEAGKAERRPAGEERWRLALLVGTALVIGAVVAGSWDSSPLSGRMEPGAHAKQKRKQEIDRRFKEGVMMLHAKQYEHALTAFHRVLELAPAMPEAHVNAGYALLGMGQPKAARDFFESATNLRPNQLNAYFGMAEALAALGDNFGALQAMETYAHLAPQDDPYRRKAEAAAWELRGKVDEERQPAGAGKAAEAAKDGKR